MKYIIEILLIITILSSCSQVIGVDEDYQISEIVVNSIFCFDDDSVHAFVTASQYIYGFDRAFNDDLSVAVNWFQNDNPSGEFIKSSPVISNDYDQMGYGTHYLMDKANLDEEAIYRVEIEHPTLGKATAQTSPFSAVDIESITLTEEKVVNEYGEMDNVLMANVLFNDPPGEDNYYQITGGYTLYGRVDRTYELDSIVDFDGLGNTFFFSSEVPNGDSIRLYSRSHPEHYSQIDPLIKPNENDIFNYSENMFSVFSDETMNGQTYKLRYVVDNSSSDYLESIDTTCGDFIQVHIELRSIPKDLYLYYVTLESYYWNDGSPFAEPVQVYSNVDNGLGIVAGYKKRVANETYGQYPMEGKTYYTWDYRGY